MSHHAVFISEFSNTVNGSYRRFSLRRLFLIVFVLCVLFAGLKFLIRIRDRSIRRRIITDRNLWPAELKSIVDESDLTSVDIASIEVYDYGIDGWFCRMIATPRSEALINRLWVPIARCRSPMQAAQCFWRYMPGIWKTSTSSQNINLFAHKDFNMDEDGNGTAYVGMHDKDRDLVFIWYHFNF